LKNKRKFTLETIKKFKLGFGDEIFYYENTNKYVKSVLFPMYTYKLNNKGKSHILTKCKVKGIDKNKAFMKTIPRGAEFGLFGMPTLRSDKK